MAKQYWAMNRGETEFKIVTSTADPGKAVEVTVDLTVVNGTTGLSKEEMVRYLGMIQNSIIKGNWPPS